MTDDAALASNAFHPLPRVSPGTAAVIDVLIGQATHHMSLDVDMVYAGHDKPPHGFLTPSDGVSHVGGEVEIERGRPCRGVVTVHLPVFLAKI